MTFSNMKCIVYAKHINTLPWSKNCILQGLFLLKECVLTAEGTIDQLEYRSGRTVALELTGRCSFALLN